MSSIPTASQAFPELSAADSEKMLNISKNWTTNIHDSRQEVLAIYNPLHAAQSPLLEAAAQDIAYGEHPRQTLDIYTPAEATDNTAKPIIVFVHGGGFIRGNKNSTPYIYANIPRLFARQGYVAINLGYRLAPEAQYPDATKDIALGLQWIRENISAWNGDSKKMVVFGHSAGGAHVAHYLGNPLFANDREGVRAAIIASGRLDNDTLPDNPNAEGVCAYYGKDTSLHPERSPLAFADQVQIPLLVAVAQYENPYLDRYSLQYAAAVADNGNIPRTIQLLHHNHTSIVAHLGLDNSRFSEELQEFIAEHIG